MTIHAALREKRKADEEEQRRLMFNDYITSAVEQGCTREQALSGFLREKLKARLWLYAKVSLGVHALGFMFYGLGAYFLVALLLIVIIAMGVVAWMSEMLNEWDNEPRRWFRQLEKEEDAQ